VNKKKVTAKVQDGVLTVALPKVKISGEHTVKVG